MADIVEKQESGGRKRKIGHKKGVKGKKKMRVFQGSEKKVKMDAKTKRIFRKKVRNYNSDNSEEDIDVERETKEKEKEKKKKKPVAADRVKFEKKRKVLVQNEEEEDDDASKDEEQDDDVVDKEEAVAPRVKFEKNQKHIENEEDDEDDDEDEEMDDFGNDDDEDVVIEHGFMMFSEGSASFKKAFKKIVKRSGTEDEVLGPVLSAHKNFVVKKLAEEAAQKKVKGDAKKEKTLLGEKGHVKPDAFSVSYEKTLIGVATKGVVTLFNAVNKAQTSQKGLNPLRAKDAKVIQKRRKEAFFSELGKRPSESDAKAGTSGSTGDGEGPAWAPLRDNYMLTTSKLKDWDKAADAPEATDDFGRQEDSSSDDEED